VPYWCSRFGRQQASHSRDLESEFSTRSPTKSASLPPGFIPGMDLGSPRSGGSGEIQEDAESPIPSEEEAHRVSRNRTMQEFE